MDEVWREGVALLGDVHVVGLFVLAEVYLLHDGADALCAAHAVRLYDGQAEGRDPLDGLPRAGRQICISRAERNVSPIELSVCLAR